MKGLIHSLRRTRSCKILVIGDLMLDSYTFGKVRRISPEAPVPVVHVQREEQRPGGAGNVILNLISLGAQVVAVGCVGKDNAGDILLKTLQSEGVQTSGIMVQEGLCTPVKNRIIAENQQIARIDREEITTLPAPLEQQLIRQLPSLLEGIRVVAISDYGKGTLSNLLLSSLIALAKERAIPIVADPKGHCFAKYAGATILKPNLSETLAASGMPPNTPLGEVATALLQITKAQALMVTQSERGLSLFHHDGKTAHFPAFIREVKDVTGAGDTVLAMLTRAIASGLSLEEAAELCNLAAGIAVERLGCARITLAELAHYCTVS